MSPLALCDDCPTKFDCVDDGCKRAKQQHRIATGANPEEFWRGAFGNEYAKRSPGDVASNVALFGHILACTDDVRSVMEFGAGVGSNLLAIRELLPEAALGAVELNENAAAKLREVAPNVLMVGSILQCRPETIDQKSRPMWDLTLSKGLLIHISPADLPAAYDALFSWSNRYVCIAEYYSPTPVEVPYRGHAGRLWKRDFAGEMLERYPLKLVEYGFAYHRDTHPQDDITWFLMEKTQ